MNKNKDLKNQFRNSIESGSKYPSLDSMRPQKSYAITVNPEPIMEFKLVETRNRMIEEILPLFHGNVKAYTELSTKNQNVHYHGIIRWDNYLELSKFYLNIKDIKNKCQFEVDELNDLDQWIPYIVKSCPQLDSICHLYKIPNILKYHYKTGNVNRYSKSPI